MKFSRVRVDSVQPDADNPRKAFDAEALKALGENMKSHGQQVPVIVYPAGGAMVLADGERRWRAAKAVGITELAAVVLSEKPDEATLGIIQMSLEVHKVSLSAIERSDLLAKIKERSGMGVGELAARLQMSQPLVTKLLALQKLMPEAKAAVAAGRIDIEKAYLLAGEENPERQAELIKQAEGLSREQVRQRIRRPEQFETRSRRAVFAMPGGFSVTVQGEELSLSDAVDRLGGLIKELRRGLAQGLDISTQQKVMKDKAK